MSNEDRVLIVMAGNEDEWQKRVEKQGRQSGRVFGSFVFHYRGLSRGLVGSTRGYFRSKSETSDGSYHAGAAQGSS